MRIHTILNCPGRLSGSRFKNENYCKLFSFLSLSFSVCFMVLIMIPCDTWWNVKSPTWEAKEKKMGWRGVAKS